MPFYRVVVRQDAWLKHESCVEAKDADQAAELALAAWRGAKTLAMPLRPTGESEGFDAAICDPEDCHEIEPEEFRKRSRNSPAIESYKRQRTDPINLKSCEFASVLEFCNCSKAGTAP